MVKKVQLQNQMYRAKLIAPALPKGAIEVTIIEREWGIERCYKSRDGLSHCIPAAFDFAEISVNT